MLLKIIAHRGQWEKPEEQNQLSAIRRALINGYSVEVDVRDNEGQIVLSHDPSEKADKFRLRDIEEFVQPSHFVFLDVKSSGLQALFSEQQTQDSNSTIIFGASLTDLVSFQKAGFKYLCRTSEFEPWYENEFTSQAAGICVDSFKSDWWDAGEIIKFSKLYSLVTIISPELHGRAFQEKWTSLKNIISKEKLKNIYLCTDQTERAKDFFSGD